MLAQKQSPLSIVTESTSKKIVSVLAQVIAVVLLSLALTLLTYGTILGLIT